MAGRSGGEDGIAERRVARSPGSRPGGQADCAHRYLRRAGHVQRGHRARDGKAGRAARHLPDVQPDEQVRGEAGGHRGLDQRPRPDRHRKPVRPGALPRPHDHHRPGQQRLHLPGRGAGDSPVRGEGSHRRDVRGGRPEACRRGNGLGPGLRKPLPVRARDPARQRADRRRGGRRGARLGRRTRHPRRGNPRAGRLGGLESGLSPDDPRLTRDRFQIRYSKAARPKPAATMRKGEFRVTTRPVREISSAAEFALAALVKRKAMKTAKLLLPSSIVLVLLAVGVPAAFTLGQRPPEPVAQPTPISTPAPTPMPTPAPQAQPAEKEKPEEKKWNVEAPPYPMPVEAEIDTDEGIWMSLDVSPDGKQIAFDLLGDIYAVPIGGGEARALTSGVAWDMQPRYSPDGRRIAFTSDRSGGDNVWVMKRDGSHATQVTKEDFRLTNSPVWTPDGDFLAARKHFTGTRSLGSGEIWLYHRSGGEGTQMVKRPDEQKDLGEPAFSPDGRYLYYSQDVTPGRIFQYNKNPHEQIYVIQRLDRDMQETWAIHGVYPAMAWTPDSRTIVVWAGGKIRRVDRASGQSAVIPFHVRGTRKAAEAVRFPVKAALDRFPVRMLRWVTVSPKGDQVVYEALGRIWVRDLPEGTPRRLTKQTDHFELYPSFSRDGRSVVYATWNDEKAGAVRVAPARGGEGRVVTEQPGLYREPVFSPDGGRIVYRKDSGGFLATPDWSTETGLYSVPAGGGKATLVSREGFAPQFGATNDRVYFTRLEETEGSREQREEEKRVFVSCALDGADPREHYVSDNATEFAISPDEKWLAFRERYSAFITPFVRTGKRIEIGPKAKSLPVARSEER